MYNLSVVIPYYKEPKKTIRNVLNSIAIQSGISHANQFEVILVNDAGIPILDEKFYEDYDFEIVHLTLKKNAGPGVARQAGLDVARGQYVTFIDADDSYLSAITFNLIYQIISAPLQQKNQVRPNLIYCKWVEEHQYEGRYFMVPKEPDDTWVFQKVYRVGFIRENNIRFDPYLRWHEDSYFNAVFKSVDNFEPAKIELPTYLWRSSKGTITRHNQGEYSISSIHVFIDAIERATKKINNPMAYPHQIMDIICYNMYSIMHPHWHDERGTPWFEFVLGKLAKLYSQYKEELDKIDVPTMNRINTSARARTLQEVERELWTLDEFLNVLSTYDEAARAKAYNHEELFARESFVQAKARTDKEGYNTPEIVDMYTLRSYGDVLFKRDELFDYKIVNPIAPDPIVTEKDPELPGKLEYRLPKDDITSDKIMLGSRILGSKANPLLATTIVEDLPALPNDETSSPVSNMETSEEKDTKEEAVSEASSSSSDIEEIKEIPGVSRNDEDPPYTDPEKKDESKIIPIESAHESSTEITPSSTIVYDPSKKKNDEKKFLMKNREVLFSYVHDDNEKKFNLLERYNVENSPLIGLSNDAMIDNYDFFISSINLKNNTIIDLIDEPIKLEFNGEPTDHCIEVGDVSYTLSLTLSKSGELFLNGHPEIVSWNMDVCEKTH